MKKFYFFCLAFVFAISANAQLPVSTLPQNKKVVIEHFTALHCGYSPLGDLMAAQIYTADPSNVLIVNIHNGNWAIPSIGEPDFRTNAGNGIGAMPGMGLNAWPGADINRVIVPAAAQQSISPYGMAQHRAFWTSSAASTKTQSAYCNIALQGTVDVNTRILTVEAEVYYTGSSPVTTNSLTIMLLEDSIHGPEVNWGNSYPANWNADGTYNHNHVLRACVTPTFGVTIPNTTAGTTFSTTATYTVPLLYGTLSNTNSCLLGRLSLIAFVTETNSITINANRGPIQLTGFSNSIDISSTNLKTDGVCYGSNFASSFRFMNYGSTPVTSAVFSYSMNGSSASTYTWSGFGVGPYQLSNTINLPNFNFTAIPTNSLNVDVVSVNGLSDQNPINDISMTTVAITSVAANNVNMQMDFTQDQYGSEIGWVIYDEMTLLAVPGASVAQGTYPKLASSGILLHTHTFVINPNNCYKLCVTDSFGDGVNSGSGSGNYILKSGTGNIITSNGQYLYGENKWFKSSVSSGIAVTQMNISGFSIYPNPAKSFTNVDLELSQNENVSISVLNSLGQEIYISRSNKFDAGINAIKLNTENWAAGVYNVNIATEKGSLSKKLVID